MTPEQLLIPRYKLYEKYPGQTEPTGTIFTKGFKGFFHPDKPSINNKSIVYSAHEKWLKEYSNLFKKLEWWEERKKKDLPQYLRYTDKASPAHGIHKVMSWQEYNLGIVRLQHYGKVSFKMSTIKPAKQEEYNNFKKKKENDTR